MQIRFHCPTDGCVAIIEYEPLEGAERSIRCPRCGTQHQIGVSDRVRSDHVVDACAVCGSKELFIRKDFPQMLGLVVVVVAGIASIVLFRTSILLAYAVLGAAVVVDFVCYLVVGKLTTCYACRAEYRDAMLNPDHEGFDLATSEKY